MAALYSFNFEDNHCRAVVQRHRFPGRIFSQLELKDFIVIMLSCQKHEKVNEMDIHSKESTVCRSVNWVTSDKDRRRKELFEYVAVTV